MTVYVLIAMFINFTGMQKETGAIQLEFTSMKKCEEGKKVLQNKFRATVLECVEIKK